MRTLLLPFLFLACVPAAVETDDPTLDTNLDSTPDDSVEPPGTQVGGIDCLDDQVEVSLLSPAGDHLSGEVTWNPDGDDVTVSRTCNSPCWLEVYGGLEVTYTFSAVVTGLETASGTASLSAEDLYATSDDGECPAEYYSTSTTVQFTTTSPDEGSGGGDCADSQVLLTVLDDQGAHASGEVWWNPDGDHYMISRTCNSPCYLEVYGEVGVTYVFEMTTADASGTTTAVMEEDDLYASNSPSEDTSNPIDEDCYGDLYMTDATMQMQPLP